MRVNLGKDTFVPYDSNVTRNFQKPPENYDSVKGNTAGSDVYILYHNKKAYPEYIVTYQF